MNINIKYMNKVLKKNTIIYMKGEVDMPKFQPYKKPLINDKIVISMRLEESRLNEIDNLASKIDISRNELINQCIEFALNNLELAGIKKDEKKENSTK